MIEPCSGGSRFSFIQQSDLAFGIVGKIMAPVSRRRAGITVDEMLAKLKRLVEGERKERSSSDVRV